MSASLYAEIQTGLDDLHSQIEAARIAGAEQTELEQRINLFEMEWFERLEEKQRHAVEVATTTITNTLGNRAVQQQQQSDAADAKLLPRMTPENQVAFWMSNRAASGTNEYREQEQAREIKSAVNREQQRINAEYKTLREALLQSVQQIESGEKPSLTQLIVLQMDKEARANPLPWESSPIDPPLTMPPIKRNGPKR
jgi:hypothetical protein